MSYLCVDYFKKFSFFRFIVSVNSKSYIRRNNHIPPIKIKVSIM